MGTRTRPLYILGTSGLAREMAQLVEACGRGRDLAGFVAALPDEVGRDLGYGVVVGDDAWLLQRGGQCDLVLGMGRPRVRLGLVNRLRTTPRFGFPNLVHSTAVLDPRHVQLGMANAITAGCIFTVSVKVGDGNLINWQATIGHDAEIGSGCVLNPSVNVSGGVRIGDGVLVGTGAQILEGLSVGDGATVGAGAVVTRDVAAGVTVVGVPAKRVGEA